MGTKVPIEEARLGDGGGDTEDEGEAGTKRGGDSSEMFR